MADENEEELIISLPVRKSAISSVESGIARLNSSHMEMFEAVEEPMALISGEKKSIVVRIVSDRLAPEGVITLRNKDMETLDVEEGDMVDISPYSKLSDELTVSWKKFISKFKRKKEEGEEQ